MSNNITVTITGPRSSGKTLIADMIGNALRGAGVSHTHSVINIDGLQGTVSNTPSQISPIQPALRGKTVDIVEDSSVKPDPVDTTTDEYKFAVAKAILLGSNINETIKKVVSEDDPWARSSSIKYSDLDPAVQELIQSLMLELYRELGRNIDAFMANNRDKLINSENTRRIALDAAGKLGHASARDLVSSAKEIQNYLNNL